MATLWVNKSGSDANNGSTAILAKLTIQAAVTASASNDTIVVGSGLYNETLLWNAKALTFSADGIVVLDGTGKSGTTLIYNYVSGGASLVMNSVSSGGKWILQNTPGANGTTVGQINGTISSFTDVVFLSDGSALRGFSSNVQGTATFTRCVFSGYSAAGINTSNTSTVSIYTNCTFHNCVAGIINTNTSSTNIINKCIFNSCTTAYDSKLNIYSNNNLFYGITNWKIAGVTYTTLPQIQALGWDLNSTVENPNFTDTTNNIFFLKSQPSVGFDVGCYPYSLTQGSANDSLGKWNIIAGAGYDNSGFYNPDGNITKNGITGDLELTSGTSGVIWSPVYDLGNVNSISLVELAATQVWPTDMIDTTTTDVRPNYQTIEIRASNTTFNQNDNVIPFYEVKYGIPFSSITGRYIQLRLTLTNIDVGS